MRRPYTIPLSAILAGRRPRGGREMGETKGWGEDREDLGGGNGQGLPEGRPAGPSLPGPGTSAAPPEGAGEAGAKTEADEAAEAGGCT